MKLTTKGRYAIIAMADLVLHSRTNPVSLKDITKRQRISLSYLEQLFSKLRESNVVQSIRGPGGGYILGRDSSEISLLDIITAVDEKIDQTQCGGAMNCNKDKPCLTHYIWTELNEKISQYMSDITLSDIATREDVNNIMIFRENENVSNHQRQKK